MFEKIQTFLLSKNNTDFLNFIEQNIELKKYLDFKEFDENSILKSKNEFFFIINPIFKLENDFIKYLSFYYQFLNNNKDWKTADFYSVISNLENIKVIFPNPYVLEINIEKCFFRAFNKNYFNFNEALINFNSQNINTHLFFPFYGITSNNEINDTINKNNKLLNEYIENNLIFVRFISQLGNNLFQLFSAQNAAIKNNKFLMIIANNIREDVFELYHYRKNTLKKNIKIINHNKNSIEKKIHYFKPFSFPKMENIMLNGYFQNIKNFISNKKLNLSPLKSDFDFEFNNEVLINIDSYLNTNKKLIGIHLRLGDYYNHTHTFYIYNLKHINNQIIFLKNKELLNDKDIKILFFTNDKKKLNQEIKNQKFKYNYEIVNLNDIQSLVLISKLEYLIIPNSTFSWFGAYMSDNLKCGLLANEWLKDGRTGNPGPPHPNIITKSFFK